MLCWQNLKLSDISTIEQLIYEIPNTLEFLKPICKVLVTHISIMNVVMPLLLNMTCLKCCALYIWEYGQPAIFMLFISFSNTVFIRPSGLQNFKFQLSYNSSMLNIFTTTPLVLAGIEETQLAAQTSMVASRSGNHPFAPKIFWFFVYCSKRRAKFQMRFTNDYSSPPLTLLIYLKYHFKCMICKEKVDLTNSVLSKWYKRIKNMIWTKLHFAPADGAVSSYVSDTTVTRRTSPVMVHHGSGHQRTPGGSRIITSTGVTDGLSTPPNTPRDHTLLTRKDVDEIRRLGQIGTYIKIYM